MREKYESLALAELREIAKSRGMKRVTGLKKAELIELMLAEDEKDEGGGERCGAQANTSRDERTNICRGSKQD